MSNSTHLVAAEARAAAATSSTGTPRGDGAVHATTTSNSSARSASSIAVGSRSMPTTRIRRPSGAKSSKNTSAHESAPGGLWAPSTITSGWWPSTSKRPGTTTVGEALVDDVGGQRGGEERLDRGEGDDGVVALVGAVQRHEHIGVDRRRRAQVDDPAADGELVLGGSKSLAAAQPRRCRRLAEHGDELGSVSPITTAEPGLMMPAFSRAMSPSVGPANSLWSIPMLVITATWASTTLVASHRPSRPTSITATSTAASANQRNAAAVHASK